MNFDEFDEAVMTHTAWKMRLSEYIGHPSGSLTHFIEVSDDKSCDLGKWIYRDAAAEYGQEMEYLELKASHTLFHLEAAKVIRLVDSGQNVDEEALLGADSEYGIASAAVVSHILRMQARVHS